MRKYVFLGSNEKFLIKPWRRVKSIYDILLKILKSCGDTMENEGEGYRQTSHAHPPMPSLTWS